MPYLILHILLFVVIPVISINTTTVTTKLGNVIGVQSSLSFNGYTYRYNEFRRIPYAKPPVGALRFSKPVPFGKWTGTLDATEFGPSCIQTPNNFVDKWLPNTNQSEDCLFLNIYVPKNASTTNKKSVMIWIHGGGYQTGTGMLYDGSYIAAIGDVIVVTINYRLAAFGFFSTGDSLIPGNYGLWDQQLAIMWVKSNINSFGGNPGSITLFGQSAGGLSVGLQAINAKNRGLFQRVISQSGVSNSIFAIKTFPRIEAKKLVQIVNCSKNLTSEAISCLRSKSADEIQNATEIINNLTQSLPNVHIGIPFAPVVDGEFIVNKPDSIMHSKSPELEFYRSLDLVVGNCDSEGASLILILLGRKDINVTNGIPSAYLCDKIIPAVSEDYYNNNSRIIPATCDFYNSNGSLTQQSIKSINFYGDIFMYSPAVTNLNIHSINNNSTQFHYLNKRPAADNSLDISWYHGASHGDELFYLFPSLISNATEDDISYTLKLVQYWSNFAKTGYVL